MNITFQRNPPSTREIAPALARFPMNFRESDDEDNFFFYNEICLAVRERNSSLLERAAPPIYIHISQEFIVF